MPGPQIWTMWVCVFLVEWDTEWVRDGHIYPYERQTVKRQRNEKSSLIFYCTLCSPWSQPGSVCACERTWACVCISVFMHSSFWCIFSSSNLNQTLTHLGTNFRTDHLTLQKIYHFMVESQWVIIWCIHWLLVAIHTSVYCSVLKSQSKSYLYPKSSLIMLMSHYFRATSDKWSRQGNWLVRNEAIAFFLCPENKRYFTITHLLNTL